MLEDYMHTRSEITESEKSEIQSRIRDLCDEEKRERSHMDKNATRQDSGMALFSPRSGLREQDRELNEQIFDQIRKHIDEIGYQKEELTMRLTHIDMNSSKWHNGSEKSNHQVQNLTIHDDSQAEEGLKPPKTEKTSENRQKFPASRDNVIEELENILDHVENCITLSHEDSSRCRKELKNLKSYIRSLITSQNS